MSDKSQSDIVVGRESKGCGCQITKFGDGRAELNPCVTCGIGHAAQALVNAGQALGAVVARIRSEAQAASVEHALRRLPKVDRNGDGG